MKEKKILTELVGKVIRVSDKTLKVQVLRMIKHQLYRKRIKHHNNYLVHCVDVSDFKVNDMVRIQPCRKISKLKSWVVVGRKSG